MNWFWQGFWPNLASTVVGALLGIPLGLWINRRIVAQGEAVRVEGERRKVGHALQVIEGALRDNHSRLSTFANVLANSTTNYYLPLDTSAWDAVRTDLTTELSDPQLRQRLAYHFDRVGALVKLNDEYVYYLVGVGASMSSSPEVKKGLHSVLTGLVSELIQESIALADVSAAEIGRLGGSTASVPVFPT